MGTVHAKSEPPSFGQSGDNLFEFNEPMELENDTMIKPTIKLDGVRARVDRVHVDGLNRTKDDIIRGTVNELFHATDFEDVIIKAHKVRRALTSLGCFRDVGVLIDVSSGPAATPDGLEVTFQVKELSRIVGGVNTTVSENEGNVVFGVKLPNVAGRGERIQAEYSMGHRSSSNFSVTATKPLPHKLLSPVLSTSVYQQSHEYPWSGYRLLDRAVLLSLAFATSPNTKHTLQWEGMVRDTSVISKTTSFKVRENSGPQMKSIVRHIVCVDRRDDALFPTRGAWVQFSSECGGVGGGVAQIKAELKAEGNVAPVDGVVLQATGALGVLHDVFRSSIADHFFLGGATSLRGFRQRGAGPHADGHAIGGKMYAAGGLHIYSGLPFVSRRGLVSELMRSHFFINFGCIPDEDEERSLAGLAKGLRASLGAGLVARVGGAARLELNYCFPIRAQRGDATAPGLQFGLGAHFL